jgi:hypothetical protein
MRGTSRLHVKKSEFLHRKKLETNRDIANYCETFVPLLGTVLAQPVKKICPGEVFL